MLKFEIGIFKELEKSYLLYRWEPPTDYNRPLQPPCKEILQKSMEFGRKLALEHCHNDSLFRFRVLDGAGTPMVEVWKFELNWSIFVEDTLVTEISLLKKMCESYKAVLALLENWKIWTFLKLIFSFEICIFDLQTLLYLLVKESVF